MLPNDTTICLSPVFFERIDARGAHIPNAVAPEMLPQIMTDHDDNVWSRSFHAMTRFQPPNYTIAHVLLQPPFFLPSADL